MATSPGRKLKVFQAQIGFFDTVIAVPSKAAALRVWGTRQDLFANGQARSATDEAAIEAALQDPETLLRRAVGSTDPFTTEASSLPNIPPAPPQKPRKTRAPPPRPPPADRSALEAAQATLKTLKTRRVAEEKELSREADTLEEKRRSAQKAYDAEKQAAQVAIDAAQKAYRKAGGRN